jgi:tetratricopeptide (TPR) repeat protein
MARVSRTASLTVAESPIECIDRIHQLFSENDIQVRRRTETEIEAHQGSQLATRAIGGWFVNPAQLPKRIHVRCESGSEESTSVVVRLEETFGIGRLDKRTKQRYRQGFEDLLQDLRSVLTPTTVDTTSDQIPTGESAEHFERALEFLEALDDAPENENENIYRDAAAELALAIHRAGASFPSAHAMLAVILYELDDVERAEHHAEIALQQDESEFRAQLVKVELALGSTEAVKLGLGNFIHLKGSFDDMYFGSVGKTIGSLVAKGRASLTQWNLKGELQKLAQSFRHNCKTNEDVDEYLFMAGTLIAIADVIADIPMLGDRPDLYAVVVDTSTDNLDQSGREEEVIRMKHKAEGRLLLGGTT